jgi:hypothetical protein
MKNVTISLNEKEYRKFQKLAEKEKVSNYALAKQQVKKLLESKVALLIIPYWMTIYALGITTVIAVCA